MPEVKIKVSYPNCPVLVPGHNSKKINFNEPTPELIERLKREHRNFESRLDEADNIINRNDGHVSATS